MVALAVVLLTAGTACACFGSSPAFLDEMKRTPIDSSTYTYWSIARTMVDEDLWDIFLKYSSSSEAKQIQALGLARSSVAYSAAGSASGSPVRVFGGDYDPGQVQGYLRDTAYTEDAGVWMPPEGTGYRPLALSGGAILFGEADALTAYVIVREGEDGLSLYDNPNVRKVADRLPDGVIVDLSEAEAGEEAYADLVSYGKSYRKGDEGQIELTAVYMFQDDPSAGQALDSIGEYLTGCGFTDVQAQREGSYVRATARIGITDFVDSLTF